LASLPFVAMDNGLLFTLTLDGAAESSAEEKRAVDVFIAGLVADLNGIEGVRATSAVGELAEPGSKAALGPLLLGVLTAEVNGELVALKVVRALASLLLGQPHPVRLKLSTRDSDGAEVTVELEGSARNREERDAFLTQAEDVVRRLR
jgi:hypothetical protein